MKEYDHRWSYFGVGAPPKENANEFPLTDAYCRQPYVLSDLSLYGGDDREEILEAFVGEVWSGQIKQDKRLAPGAKE